MGGLEAVEGESEVAGVFAELVGSGDGVCVVSAVVSGLSGGLWDDSASDGDGVD